MKKIFFITGLLLTSAVFAADKYCPQGFDANCTGNSCTFSNYIKGTLPMVEHSQVNSGTTGTFIGLYLTQAQWSNTPPSGVSIQCIYHNAAGQSLTVDSADKDAPDSFAAGNQWQPGSTARLCTQGLNQKTDTTVCPFQA